MSFLLVNKVKKSNLPGPLKAVLEAYLTYANKDGTSIRPTAKKVANRAGKSQSTVHHITPEIVRLGLLVHDLDQDGNWLTHDYDKHGTWAYVYHANLSALDNPHLVSGWELKKSIISEKRRTARKGRGSRQLELFGVCKFADPSSCKFAETGYVKIADPGSVKIADRPYPTLLDQTLVDPSAASAAEETNELTNEELAPLAPDSEEKPAQVVSGNLVDLESLHPFVSDLEKLWHERTKLEFTVEELGLADTLIRAHRYRVVEAVLRNALFDRPLTANWCWNRFAVFARNWGVNHEKYLSWCATRQFDKRYGNAARKPVEKFDPVPERGWVRSNIAEYNELARRFQDNKVGDWTMSPKELTELSLRQEHAYVAVRYAVEEGIAVTKQQFVDLMIEAAGTEEEAAMEAS